MVMPILPCEAAVVPAQRHARVYSPEPARTKPPRRSGSPLPWGGTSMKLPTLVECRDHFQRSQTGEAILVNAEPDFGVRQPGISPLGDEQERVGVAVVAELHEKIGLVQTAPLLAAQRAPARGRTPLPRAGSVTLPTQ